MKKNRLEKSQAERLSVLEERFVALLLVVITGQFGIIAGLIALVAALIALLVK